MQTFSPLHPIRAKRLAWYIKQLKPVGYWPLNEKEGTTAYDRSAPKRTSYAVTSITRSGAVATVTTTASHGLASGQITEISGAVETEYNGQFQVTVTGVTTFTYAVSGTPDSPATGTILNKRDIQLNGTITGATMGQDGRVGKAFSFDGNDNVNAGADARLKFLGTNPFTIGCIFKCNNTGVGYQDFLTNKGSPGDGYNMYISETQPQVQFSRTAGGVERGVVKATVNGNTYFGIGVYTGTQEILYLNGIANNPTDDANSISSHTADFKLGSSFKSLIQHAFVFDRTLSATEILKLAKIAGLA